MKPCEICGSKAHHKHHIQSRSLGGSNAAYNIASLCASCHMEVHEGNIILEGQFLGTSGYVLMYHRKNEKSITGQTPKCFIFGKTA